MDLDRAGKIIDALDAPAPIEKIIEWLTLCAALTAIAKEEDASATLKLKAYAERLCDYPGDVVHKALKEWPDKNKWFPTWAELRAECEVQCGKRGEFVNEARRILRAKRSAV